MGATSLGWAQELPTPSSPPSHLHYSAPSPQHAFKWREDAATNIQQHVVACSEKWCDGCWLFARRSWSSDMRGRKRGKTMSEQSNEKKNQYPADRLHVLPPDMLSSRSEKLNGKKGVEIVLKARKAVQKRKWHWVCSLSFLFCERSLRQSIGVDEQTVALGMVKQLWQVYFLLYLYAWQREASFHVPRL